MTARRSTIKDVAAAADVSISTVSLVINGKGYVSPETRSRILEAARRLDFVPRQAARDLAARKTGNIGFVLSQNHFTRSEPFYTRIFLGTEFEAHQHELYVLLTTIPTEYYPEEHTPRFLRQRNIDGLIIAGKVSRMFIRQVERAGIPFICVDYQLQGRPSINVDNFQGASRAVAHLIERGHRRIGLLGADLHHPSLRTRLDGFRARLQEAGLSFDESCLLVEPDAEPVPAVGERLAGRLFSMKEPPTAVFCVNDALALGVLRHAAHRDVNVPEQLAVIGFDDVSGAELAYPPLTTIRIPKEQLGELAVRVLVEQMGDPAPSSDGTSEVVVPIELVVRGST